MKSQRKQTEAMLIVALTLLTSVSCSHTYDDKEETWARDIRRQLYSKIWRSNTTSDDTDEGPYEGLFSPTTAAVPTGFQYLIYNDSWPIGEIDSNDSMLCSRDFEMQEAQFAGSMKIIATSCDMPARQYSEGHSLDEQIGSNKIMLPYGTWLIAECKSHNYTMCANSDDHYLNMGWVRSMSRYQGYKRIIDNETSQWAILFHEEVSTKRWVTCFCGGVGLGGEPTWSIGTPTLTNVGYAPRNLTGFRCVVYNYENALCTWDSQAHLNVTWQVCFGLVHDINVQSESMNCPKTFKEVIDEARSQGKLDEVDCNRWATEEREKKVDCKTATTLAAVDITPKAHLNGSYMFNITATNDFGTYNTSFTYGIYLVKIAEPQFQLQDRESERNITLSWNAHLSKEYPKLRVAHTIHGLDTQVIAKIKPSATVDYYRIAGRDRQVIKDKHTKNEGGGPANKLLMNITVDSLIPDTTYDLFIRWKVHGEIGIWSDNATMVIKTKPDKPDRGPAVSFNGFTVNGAVCGDNRVVIAYWRTLTIQTGGNGNITSYQIRSDGSYVYQNISASVRQISVCVSEERAQLYINGVNKNGTGASSSLTIPPAESLDSGMKACMIRAREPESSEERSEGEGAVDDPSKRYVVVDWSLLAGYVRRQKLSNLTYTVFWCESPGAMCQDTFTWRELPIEYTTNHTNYTLSVNKDKTYSYGVSIHRDSDHPLSGILWSPCVYQPSSPNSDKDITFNATSVNQTHSRLVISLTPKCAGAMTEDIDIHYKCSPPDSVSQSHLHNDMCGQVMTIANVCPYCEKEHMIRTPVGVPFKIWLTIRYHEEMGARPTKSYDYTNTSTPDNVNDSVIIGAVLSVLCLAVIVVVIAMCCYVKRKRRNAQKIMVEAIQPVLGENLLEKLGEDSGSDYDEDDIFLNYRHPVAPVITDPTKDHINLEMQAREEVRLLQHQQDLERAREHIEGRERRPHPSHQQSVDSDYWTTTGDTSGESGVVRYKRNTSQDVNIDIAADEDYMGREREGESYHEQSVSACLRDISEGIRCRKLSIQNENPTHTEVDDLESQCSSGEEMSSYLKVAKILERGNNSDSHLPEKLQKHAERRSSLHKMMDADVDVCERETGGCSTDDITLSACLNAAVSSDREEKLFDGKTLQDLLMTPGNTGDNLIITTERESPPDKVKLRKQISSGVSSMNSSAENLPGSGYLQLDRILDGGGVNSGNHGNDSCNESLHAGSTDNTHLKSRTEYKNLQGAAVRCADSVIASTADNVDYQPRPNIEDTSHISVISLQSDINHILEGMNDVSM